MGTAMLSHTHCIICTSAQPAEGHGRSPIINKAGVVSMAKLDVDFDASCINTHAYQPCLLQWDSSGWQGESLTNGREGVKYVAKSSSGEPSGSEQKCRLRNSI